MINLSSNSQLNKFTTVPANDEWLPKFCNVLNIKYNPENMLQLTNYTPNTSQSSDFNVDLCDLITSTKGILIAGVSVQDNSNVDINPDYNATDSIFNDLVNSDSFYDLNSDKDEQYKVNEDIEYPFTGHNYFLPVHDITAIKLIRPKHFKHYLVIEAGNCKYYFSTSSFTFMFNDSVKDLMSNFASRHHIPFSINIKHKSL